MEARKWEDLPMDCLVDILGRVGSEMRLFDVPFVCKSWYKATLNPLCWKQLVFPQPHGGVIYYFSSEPFVRFRSRYRLKSKISMDNFRKVVVERSDGCATTMVNLSVCFTKDALTYVADKCPALKKLVLHESGSNLNLSSVIGKFRNLESLEICTHLRFSDIVTEIGAHCENFVALSLVATSYKPSIGEKEVTTIVSSLPKIKYLTLRKVFIERQNLIKILKGCMELVLLDVSGCRGFDEDDEELSKLASHIPSFKCSGSVFDTWADSDSDGYDDSFRYDCDGYDSYDYDSDFNVSD